MGDFFIQIFSGVVVGIVLTFIGTGGPRKVVVHGSSIKKTGKKIIIFSWIMILSGLFLMGQNTLPQGGINFKETGSIYGITLGLSGLVGLIIGRIVAWFQRN